MRTCPRCGYVDPAQIAASEKYEKARPKRDRAAYFRKRRKKEKKSGPTP